MLLLIISLCVKKHLTLQAITAHLGPSLWNPPAPSPIHKRNISVDKKMILSLCASPHYQFVWEKASRHPGYYDTSRSLVKIRLSPTPTPNKINISEKKPFWLLACVRNKRLYLPLWLLWCIWVPCLKNLILFHNSWTRCKYISLDDKYFSKFLLISSLCETMHLALTASISSIMAHLGVPCRNPPPPQKKNRNDY